MSVYKLSFHVILSLCGDPSQAQGDKANPVQGSGLRVKSKSIFSRHS